MNNRLWIFGLSDIPDPAPCWVLVGLGRAALSFVASRAVGCPPVLESHLGQRAAGSSGDMSILLTVQACRLVDGRVTRERRTEQRPSPFTHKQVLAHFSLFLMVSEYRKKIHSGERSWASQLSLNIRRSGWVSRTGGEVEDVDHGKHTSLVFPEWAILACSHWTIVLLGPLLGQVSQVPHAFSKRRRL